MGRYKDYREPKRRGYDEGFISNEGGPIGRPNYSSPALPQVASAAVDAVVKWFNPDKGFGFVATDGGGDAFLHIRRLEAAGHHSVAEGARIKVRIGKGQKGPEVAEVIEVDTTTAPVRVSKERRVAPGSAFQRLTSEPTEESIGSVKWYNLAKGFGFIRRDDGGNDVFIHAKTLNRAGLSGLREGQRVQMQIGPGQKGPEARSIEALD
jgi:CspA family cold shock protein